MPNKTGCCRSRCIERRSPSNARCKYGHVKHQYILRTGKLEPQVCLALLELVLIFRNNFVFSIVVRRIRRFREAFLGQLNSIPIRCLGDLTKTVWRGSTISKNPKK